MPYPSTPRVTVDLTHYEESQLTDDEIIELETVRQAWAEHHARRKRERFRQMTSFRWKAGMP